MKDEPKQGKLGRYSFYIGLGALMWWLVIFMPSLFPGVRANPDVQGIKNLFLGITTTILNIIGFILGIIGMRKKEAEKKYAVLGILVNAPIFVITILFIMTPLIIGYATGVTEKHVPDQTEINTRFSEFLIEPTNIQGIEAYGKEGEALFKYNSKAKDSLDLIERQAVAKGWIKIETDSGRIAFKREKKMSDKLNIHQYEFSRVSNTQVPDLLCVGYDRFLITEPVTDFKNSVDMKVIENTTWKRFNSCAEGRL